MLLGAARWVRAVTIGNANTAWATIIAAGVNRIPSAPKGPEYDCPR